MDILEYIHSQTYVHMDIKGANILLGLDRTAAGQAFLVDFGLACHHTTKDFKPDPKKMHNGTIEYTSRDAHLGIPTMRGDFEVLAYNLLHWIGGSLPWEQKKLLPNPKAVQESKEAFMKSIDSSVKTSLAGTTAAAPVIGQFFKYVAELKYEQAPDYNKCRKMFADALKSIGKTNAGELEFKLQPMANKTVPAKTAAVAKHKTIRTKSPAAKQAKPIVPIESSDDEDNDQDVAGPSHRIKTPVQRSRKRAVPDDDTSPASVPTPKKTKPPAAKPTSSAKTIINTQPSAVPGTLTVNSHSSNDAKKPGKTYEINFELNVSIDANVVLNVRRKDPKDGRSKGKKVDALPSNVSQANGDNADDNEVIPSSPEKTPVARVRVSKKANVTPARRSPRGQ